MVIGFAVGTGLFVVYPGRIEVQAGSSTQRTRHTLSYSRNVLQEVGHGLFFSIRGICSSRSLPQGSRRRKFPVACQPARWRKLQVLVERSPFSTSSEIPSQTSTVTNTDESQKRFALAALLGVLL